jgi:hypothetical protein
MQLHTIRLLKLLEEYTHPSFQGIPRKAREQLYQGIPLTPKQRKWVLENVEMRLLGSTSQLAKVEELEDHV